MAKTSSPWLIPHGWWNIQGHLTAVGAENREPNIQTCSQSEYDVMQKFTYPNDNIPRHKAKNGSLCGLRQTWWEPQRKSAERPENHSSLQLLIQCDRAQEICEEGWKKQLVEVFCSCHHYQSCLCNLVSKGAEIRYSSLFLNKITKANIFTVHHYLFQTMFPLAGPQKAICCGKASC